ncbi:ly-6/neurotoxin-like protein 1 isoform X3 [Balaenoptera musculus]|uniref:Ly-6/neurotoxin-like protein 1 isoform X3 n=1 Tax=Balaenoptera musculus TaxID=9771 RepID=A0A8B8VNU3_BALMU|nr:ly-6/neurotoxin-like protein 1 isoform X3 [Balaenoptera musculus]
MAPLLALFLVALVGLPVAQALDCHVCAYNGENCFNPVRCPAMVTYCMTTRTWSWPTSPSLCRLQPDQDEVVALSTARQPCKDRGAPTETRARSAGGEAQALSRSSS